MIDSAIQPALTLSVLLLDPKCEDTNIPDIVSYRLQSASASLSSL